MTKGFGRDCTAWPQPATARVVTAGLTAGPDIPTA